MTPRSHLASATPPARRHGRAPGPGSASGVSPGQVPPPALELLSDARRLLDHAAVVCTPSERYASAHLAALRGAAALLAARARPEVGRRRLRSAWELLSRIAPEFSEWAGFFAAGAAKRAAAEAGLPRAASQREADDLVRDVETFLTLVGASLRPARPRSSAVPVTQHLLASQAP